MRIKELSREDSKNIFQTLNASFDEEFFGGLDNDYLQIRRDLLEIHNKYEGLKDYKYDLEFGLSIYEYFNSKNWFNENVASNYGFWRYLCIKVVPDIIVKRHGLVAAYYYEKNVRIYLSTLWWYIHMSYQGDMVSTKECLESLNTDYILQLVERPGREGTYIEISREMMKRISKLPKEELNKKIGNANLFRRILIQNTAKVNNFNLLLENDSQGYVENILQACNTKEV